MAGRDPITNAEIRAYRDIAIINGEPLPANILQAYDIFVTDMKSFGYWYNMDRIWLFPPEAPLTAKHDIVSILGAQYTYTYQGTYTYNANGWAGDGDTGTYIDTNYRPTSDAIHFSDTGGLVYTYCQADLLPESTLDLFGVLDASNDLRVSQKSGSFSSTYFSGSGPSGSASGTALAGIYIHTEPSTDVYLWANNYDLLGSQSQIGIRPNLNMFIGGTNDNDSGAQNTSTIQLSHFAIGGDFDVGDAYGHANLVDNLQIALGRAVI